MDFLTLHRLGMFVIYHDPAVQTIEGRLACYVSTAQRGSVAVVYAPSNGLQVMAQLEDGWSEVFNQIPAVYTPGGWIYELLDWIEELETLALTKLPLHRPSRPELN